MKRLQSLREIHGQIAHIGRSTLQKTGEQEIYLHMCSIFTTGILVPLKFPSSRKKNSGYSKGNKLLLLAKAPFLPLFLFVFVS